MKVAQSSLILCDPRGYTVHGILQARILEWVAFPFSRGSSQPRDLTQVSCIAGRFFTSWATREKLILKFGWAYYWGRWWIKVLLRKCRWDPPERWGPSQDCDASLSLWGSFFGLEFLVKPETMSYAGCLGSRHFFLFAQTLVNCSIRSGCLRRWEPGGLRVQLVQSFSECGPWTPAFGIIFNPKERQCQRMLKPAQLHSSHMLVK